MWDSIRHLNALQNLSLWPYNCSFIGAIHIKVPGRVVCSLQSLELYIPEVPAGLTGFLYNKQGLTF